MKVYELVAAMVLRVGQKDGSMRPLTWGELGNVFFVTKDIVRHRLNRFKEKYNVVDADVHTPGWNRTFLRENTPEIEKSDIKDLIHVPGDVVKTNDGRIGVVYDVGGCDDVLHIAPESDTIVYSNSRDIDNIQVEEFEIEYNATYQSQETAAIEPLQYLITPAVLVVVRDGQPLSIDKSHKNFEKIKESLEASNWQAAVDFIDMKNALTKYSNGRVIVQDGKVTLDGEQVHGKIVNRLVNSLMEENIESLESLTNFLDKCDDNPDFMVVSRIYDFMTHNDLRLDKDGYVLAYKVVKHDYKDKYTGTMDNSPGQLLQMKRNKVNPKDTETCSHGLHVAAKKYIPQYGNPSSSTTGDKVVLCRIHPKDFVSIPTDYNSMKARVCEYEVLKDVTELFLEDKLD